MPMQLYHPTSCSFSLMRLLNYLLSASSLDAVALTCRAGCCSGSSAFIVQSDRLLSLSALLELLCFLHRFSPPLWLFMQSVIDQHLLWMQWLLPAALVAGALLS